MPTIEEIEREAATHGDPVQSDLINLAQRLAGAVLWLDASKIPPEQLKWLQGFLRGNLSRPEYRVLAAAYGWSRPSTQARVIEEHRRLHAGKSGRAWRRWKHEHPAVNDPCGPELDDDIPF